MLLHSTVAQLSNRSFAKKVLPCVRRLSGYNGRRFRFAICEMPYFVF